MVIVKFRSLMLRAALACCLCMALAGIAAAQVVTASFQNGVNGYTGTFDRMISEREAHNVDGSTVTDDFMDGYKKDSSPDEQDLIRFDDIIGDGAGQIPAGATILSAELILTTSVVGSAQTSGPYGVSGILQGFDSTTVYYNYLSNTPMIGRGPWWMDGSATRPTGGFGFQIPGIEDSANVTSLVQSWADGTENMGFVIQAGTPDAIDSAANTSDGWSIRTTGYPIPDSRPKLSVMYTTAPVRISTFQEGVNGYAGTTMAIVNSGSNALIQDADEKTTDGSTVDQIFLDGIQFADATGATSSPDTLALLKFDNVFGTEAGQAPSDVPVARAWVVITTGDISSSCESVGPYSAYTMLRQWDLTSLHSSFGAINGLQVADGDISPALDSPDGFIRGAEVWFNVTEYLEGVRTGATDNGIAIVASGTADGWQIHATGSSTPDARPRLVVFSADLGSETVSGN